MAGDDGTPASGRKSKQADDEVEPVFSMASVQTFMKSCSGRSVAQAKSSRSLISVLAKVRWHKWHCVSACLIVLSASRSTIFQDCKTTL